MIIHEGGPYLRTLRRDYEGSLREFQQIRDLDSNFYKAYSGMGRVYSLMGRYDEAVGMFRQALRISGDIPNITAALGQTLALAGRRDEARWCLDELHSTARTRYVPSTCFAIVHIGLGEWDQSLAWLEAACDQHELPISLAKVHPVYDPLRSQPGFKNILARLGFLP